LQIKQDHECSHGPLICLDTFVTTERGDINRAVEVTNSKLRQQQARIKKAKDWLYAIPLTDAPTLVKVMNSVADGKNLNTQWQKIRNLQTSAGDITNDFGSFGGREIARFYLQNLHYSL
jgi:hypothetical protein